MSKVFDDEYNIEQEAALSGMASMIARGHTPQVIAQGWLDLLNSTDDASRSRRRALAKILHEIFEAGAARGGSDAEGCRNLAAQLKEIWETNP